MLVLATLAAALAALPLAQSVPCQILHRGRIHPYGHPDKCLAVEAEAVLPYKFGQWLQIRDCKDQQGFVWLVDDLIDKTGGVLQMEGTGNVNWCLNAGIIPRIAWKPKDGSEAQLSYCGNAIFGAMSPQIKWTYRDHKLMFDSPNVTNYFCLDNENGRLTEGNKVQIWQCAAGNTNQLWDIEYLGDD